MEPMKGHESPEDRSDRPFIKAPIPLNLETESKKKSKKKNPEVNPVTPKAEKPEKVNNSDIFEEGLLFQREPDEDKLKPAEKPQPVFQAQPEQQSAQQDEQPDEPDAQPPQQEQVVRQEPESSPDQLDQTAFDAEVQRQMPMAAEEVAEQSQPDPEVDSEYLAALERDDEVGDSASVPAETSIPNTEPRTTAETATPLTPLDAAREAAANAYREQADSEQASQTPVTDPHLVGAVPLRPTSEQPNFNTPYGMSSPEQSHQQPVRNHSENKPIQQKLRDQIRKLKQKLIKQKPAPAPQNGTQRAPEQMPAAPVAKRVGPELMTMPLPAQPAERPAPSAPPTPETAPPIINQSTAEQHVLPVNEQLPPTASEQMLPAQLVQVAERIYVDGITVRSMFEVGRFDQESLQRIVDTYLKGGNVSKIVYEEVQRHDRERFNRFETLNQVPRAGAAAMYGPITQQTATQPVQHGSLPRPLAHAQYGQPVNPANNQQPSAQPATQSSNTSTAEKVVLGVSIFFVIIAAVILIGLFTRG